MDLFFLKIFEDKDFPLNVLIGEYAPGFKLIGYGMNITKEYLYFRYHLPFLPSDISDEHYSAIFSL